MINDDVISVVFCKDDVLTRVINNIFTPSLMLT